MTVSRLKKAGKSIGFVPTMGALHQGHLSLLNCCRSQNNMTVASIFVNPTQFNNPDDYACYPRTPESDLEMLRNSGCDIVFLPDEHEMYPAPDNRMFDLGGLDKVMEGLYRPGHFNGVAMIITRLFDLIMPHRVYLGQKDFQQVAVIRKLIHAFTYPTEVVVCPTVREADGLAMSSRNRLLNAEQRKHAAEIYKVMSQARTLAATSTVERIREFVISTLNNDPYLSVEYFELVDDVNLMPVSDFGIKTGVVGCIAVKVGKVRLIDNMFFSS